jgi:hypothetical protein
MSPDAGTAAVENTRWCLGGAWPAAFLAAWSAIVVRWSDSAERTWCGEGRVRYEMASRIRITAQC